MPIHPIDIEEVEQGPRVPHWKAMLVVSLIAISVGASVVYKQLHTDSKATVLGAKASKVTPTPTKGSNTQEDLMQVYAQVQNQAESALKNVTQTGTEVGSQLVAQASSLVSNTASGAASGVGDFVMKNTITTVVDQFNKLPTNQKEEVKQAICK